MSSLGVGARLRQERVGKGLGIDDIARDTRIAPRFLEAIETEDYSILPGLLFTRNFVRQYALTLQLDPDPLLAELPKPDELAVPLPNPPARPRSSYRRDRRVRSMVTAVAWLLLLGGVGLAAYYMRFNRAPRAPAKSAAAPVSVARTREAPSSPLPPAAPVPSSPVKVSLTAREAAWVQVSADGKPAFTGTLRPNESKEISAAEQVKVLTGNAGALTISLNGKTLESLGPVGQVREVRLTAEGPQFPSKGAPPAPDPL